MRKALTFALIVSALSLHLTAHADTIDQFTFSFATPPGFLPANLVIDLPASPSVSNNPFGPGICFQDCFSVYGQVGAIHYVVDFEQFEPGGGTLVEYAVTDPFYGPPSVPRAYTHIFVPNIFSGSITDPTFLTGTFDGEYQPVVGYPEFPGTITIEPLDNSIVPEPSTLTLMATGILGAITTLKSRKPRSGRQ
jgi:PEP-CTERM motif